MAQDFRIGWAERRQKRLTVVQPLVPNSPTVLAIGFLPIERVFEMDRSSDPGQTLSMVSVPAINIRAGRNEIGSGGN